MKEPGTLFVVATPIGNLGDLSVRAAATLAQADLILCEDTRVTQKLLSTLEAKGKLLTLHQHSTDGEMQTIIQAIADGQNAAMVTDAGTPNISDPGGRFVALTRAAGLKIVPIPGASALIAALSVCGFPADEFTFLGFPPHKKGRQTFFAKLTAIEHTVVFYESKHRIEKTLTALPADRLMMVGRELTKLYETILVGRRDEIMRQLGEGSSKGEFVIVLAPKKWTI